MMIHMYLPHSDRQVDWIGRSRPFKNCWGFGINTFLVISFKSWVTGIPPAPSFFLLACCQDLSRRGDGWHWALEVQNCFSLSLSLSLPPCWTCFDNRTITLHVRASFYNIPVGTKTWGTVLEKNIGLKWWPLTFERGFRALNSWLLTSEAEISLPTTFLNFLC